MNKGICIDCDSITKGRGLRCHSCVNKGNKLSEETKEKIRQKHLGIKLSLQHKQKISKALKDKKRKFYYCIDCGKEVSNKNAKRCQKCAYIGKLNPNFGRDLSGDKSPAWIDGRSFENYPIEFNQQLKDKIRKRDNYICQNCNMTEAEHLIVWGRNLCIHHIDYSKHNCKENNLITLCHNCNIRANYNRNYWIIHYRNLLRRKTNGTVII